MRGRDPFEHKRLIDEILARESYAVRQMVASAGVRKTGRSWVDREAIDDVTSMALARVADFLSKMKGTSIGELRNGVSQCVRFAVGDYVRDDQRSDSVPVDPGHFTDALPPEQQQYAELTGLAASGSAEDRANFKERLELVALLDSRAADVVKMRGLEGRSSKEVAGQLGLTAANVDQIFSRSIRRLLELSR